MGLPKASTLNVDLSARNRRRRSGPARRRSWAAWPGCFGQGRCRNSALRMGPNHGRCRPDLEGIRKESKVGMRRNQRERMGFPDTPVGYTSIGRNLLLHVLLSQFPYRSAREVAARCRRPEAASGHSTASMKRRHLQSSSWANHTRVGASPRKRLEHLGTH